MNDLSGKRVTVMGLGRFGGGIGVARWLAAQGADVLVTDLEPAEELDASVRALGELATRNLVRLRLGGHNVSDFTDTDLVVASPAVPHPWENRFLRAAEAARVPVTTEIGLVVERLPDPSRVIAVTGSVGKSTTSAMIAHALRAADRPVEMGGNIGGSLLSRLDQITPATWVVLELSSFMLYWLEDAFRARGRAPGIAVLTNISPNHLDWHNSLSHYEDCKRFVYQFQPESGAAVFGPTLGGLAAACTQRTVVVEPSMYPGSLGVPGTHNIENAATALAACSLAHPEVPTSVFVEGLSTFPGLPHRLQLTAETQPGGAGGGAGGGGRGRPIRFYNDSKSTTPDAALRAIDAVAEAAGGSRAGIHLIAGGYDKKSDLGELALAARSLAAVYTIGDTGPLIASLAKDAVVHECKTLAGAVAAAFPRLRPGDSLLLSPGCASWDQYKNYEQRGEEFIRLVRERLNG